MTGLAGAAGADPVAQGCVRGVPGSRAPDHCCDKSSSLRAQGIHHLMRDQDVFAHGLPRAPAFPVSRLDARARDTITNTRNPAAGLSSRENAQHFRRTRGACSGRCASCRAGCAPLFQSFASHSLSHSPVHSPAHVLARSPAPRVCLPLTVNARDALPQCLRVLHVRLSLRGMQSYRPCMHACMHACMHTPHDPSRQTQTSARPRAGIHACAPRTTNPPTHTRTLQHGIYGTTGFSPSVAGRGLYASPRKVI